MTEDKWLSLDAEEQNKYYCVKVAFEYDRKLKDSITMLSFVRSESLYKYNIRLQPFITSFARKKIGNTIIKHFDDIVRVQTDGVGTDRLPMRMCTAIKLGGYRGWGRNS